jgi:hypothetical protein
VRLRARLENALASVLRTLEALDDGDQLLAEQILAGLAHDLENALSSAKGIRCGNCGLRFDWPGQLAEHMRYAHPFEGWKKPA